MPSVGRSLLVLALVVASGCVGTATSAARPRAPARLTVAHRLEVALLRDINATRRRHGLAPLRLNRALSAAAAEHSFDMARRGYFAHASRDGTAFWKRVRTHYPVRGYSFWAIGENLLWSPASVSSGRAVGLWMASAPHRRNLLERKWREVGISAVHVGAAGGTYGGRDVVILTTDFGVRR